MKNLTPKEMQRFTLPSQVKAFHEGVSFPFALQFVNDFQIAALIARIPHEQAVQLNSLERILDFFRASPEALDQAVISLTINITVNDLIYVRHSMVGQVDPQEFVRIVYNQLIELQALMAAQNYVAHETVELIGNTTVTEEELVAALGASSSAEYTIFHNGK